VGKTAAQSFPRTALLYEISRRMTNSADNSHSTGFPFPVNSIDVNYFHTNLRGQEFPDAFESLRIGPVE